MSSDLDPATVLEEAADLLLIRGRCRGQGQDSTGRFCVLGALAHVQGLKDEQYHESWVMAMDTLLPAAVAHLGWDDVTSREAVWSWNDSLRSADDDFEVIDTLRHVAKSLRNGEVPA